MVRMARWWTRPWAVALGLGVAVLVAAFVPPLLTALLAPPAVVAPAHGLPWQIERTPDGRTRVFGVTPGRSTLAELDRSGALQLAVVAAPGESGALEAYLDPFDAGFVSGRLVVSAVSDDAQRRRWREGASRREGGDPAGPALRYRLSHADRAEALGATIVGLTYIPNAQLDEATLRQRFGEPAERRPGSDTRLEHWLYPSLGLAVVLDREGREVLQYVAPQDFDARLRTPLLAPR